jgi:hypothetical protein
VDDQPAESEAMKDAQFEDLIRRADAYILALRQALYSHPGLRDKTWAQLNELGSSWRAACESVASHIPELTGRESKVTP